MVFQPGAYNLALVIQIFRPDKAHHAVDQERLKHARYAVGARFQAQLVHAVMCFGGKRAALAGFEIHAISNWQIAVGLWLLALGFWLLAKVPISVISVNQW